MFLSSSRATTSFHLKSSIVSLVFYNRRHCQLWEIKGSINQLVNVDKSPLRCFNTALLWRWAIFVMLQITYFLHCYSHSFLNTRAILNSRLKGDIKSFPLLIEIPSHGSWSRLPWGQGGCSSMTHSSLAWIFPWICLINVTRTARCLDDGTNSSHPIVTFRFMWLDTGGLRWPMICWKGYSSYTVESHTDERSIYRQIDTVS